MDIERRLLFAERQRALVFTPTRLCRNARGGHGRVRQELTAKALAISVPAGETRVLKYFQERMPYGRSCCLVCQEGSH
jgi:hypothetical protein